MASVKQWALGITICAVIGAVVSVLLPDGSIKKIARTAVSLFLLAALLSPFVSEIDTDELLGGLQSPGKVETQRIRGGIAESTKAAVKEKIEQILVSAGINNSKVNIDITIDGENQMQIESVKITAPAEYKQFFDSAREQIFSQLGIKAEIGVGE